MVPFNNDIKSNYVAISRDEMDEHFFLKPEKGSKVSYNGKPAAVTKIPDIKNKSDKEFTLVYDDGEEVFQVKRQDFQVKEMPMRLFEQRTIGFIPQREDYFENVFLKYGNDKVHPNMSLEEVQERAKKYYRAIGRFLLHVISDGCNPIPATVMPEFFRNGESFGALDNFFITLMRGS